MPEATQMDFGVSVRGFRIIVCEASSSNEMPRLVQESSAVGDYEDSLEKPGSSFLWVGDKHHLNREGVAVLVKSLEHWLETGRLPESQPQLT